MFNSLLVPALGTLLYVLWGLVSAALLVFGLDLSFVLSLLLLRHISHCLRCRAIQFFLFFLRARAEILVQFFA